MKIRTDFVTNSSSSSFITVTMQNTKYAKKLCNTGLGKISYCEETDDYYNDSTDEVDDFFDAFYDSEWSHSIDEFYIKYIRENFLIDCNEKDISISGHDSVWGEVFGYREDIERKYGVACDRIIKEYDIYYDSDGKQINKQQIELEEISHITEEALENIITGRKTIENYLGKLDTSNKCLIEILRAFQTGLSGVGKSVEEIEVLLGKYSTFLDAKNSGGVNEINELILKSSPPLNSVVLPDSDTKSENRSNNNSTQQKCVFIPDGVVKIEKMAYKDCALLSSIVIPASVKEIGDSAFSGCRSLTSINIPDSVTKIGDSAFENCVSLAIINMPASVKEIGDSAFSGCRSLTNINIPDSVKKIGNNAFSICTSLISINIPAGLKRIRGWTFAECTSLTSINIPAGVKEVKDFAFMNCESLASIEYFADRTFIDEMAFCRCTSLINIIKKKSP